MTLRDCPDVTRLVQLEPHCPQNEIWSLNEELALRRIAEHVRPGDYLTKDHLMLRNGWTQTMYERLTLRRLSVSDPEDTQYSTGVIEVLRSGEVVVMDKGRLARTQAQGVDIFDDVQRRRKDIEGQIFLCHRQPPGFDCIVRLVPQLLSASSNANFFCRSIAPVPSGRRRTAQHLVVPEIFTPKDLAWYGFALCSVHEPFRLRSPAKYIPVLPQFVGNTYHRNIRGGLFIEKHGAIAGSIHIWIPMTKDASGFVLAARQVSASPYRLRFAKIRIPYGSILVCSSSAWHCMVLSQEAST